ncbi:MAG: glutaminyl-tRNA synthase (glutamine-hydrolyzing) subunit A [Candidatus Ryanbacteria bacterium RIFCSPHIGHO2_02_FULL_45_43]|uniref:Glutamyl-tRNA(Gln) amidotransferase subunit A n=1 Tax=Candidatus Ryanbacteria bacterium RIFCSPHIGHO2_01_45_13 TaxID=1802112 RepID=A0A1G2FVT1_9BACT|nr:MAG: glutaminyl-tRNA synthase (glutamine-hydrolyzing) subunit A [Candidatus Ryanbacteria bacterium RIFCSPHIGHO2_01_45_13]OGZ42621.1 MAG: glutaminyl-tRNA synthase (glutamine-hydrolyzing) subunit A [Candidatus Ryanbacteria bacterium RIFCSPHIGHO2_01_FULL_44_130]OGZ49115.1 MAG: glutaminyl-tRNA synthase (glutamine-hydrolyzing) subunit A [Candidatus Ryanbacteria bacterium RIFCSPHIGHO2_02_FULL_45_43]OGZ50483.1 MAG: glutaminyl-tRNA synthase (glutamine-hydrolyzing) subunit A [Candidatus Ryanbacteria b
MSDAFPKTIEKAHSALIKKEISCEELTRHYLDVISERDGRIHAFLEVFDDASIQHAKRVDEKIVRDGGLGMLEGIPIAVKDNILIEGTRTTAASRILANYSASYDAHVIRLLKSAGSIFLGKTNMDEFAMGSSCENSAFGPTRNPYDETRVPGGSSGGSTAAVAAGECLAALGSDTGGSIRQPAAFCGVVGLKPTYGAVSRSGLIAMASSLDQVGPIANTVGDTELLFYAIRGKDAQDSTSVETKKRKKTGGLVIGIPKEYFGGGIGSGERKVIEDALALISNSGVTMKNISLPHTDYALSCYYIIVPAEVSANLSRYDGIRYGFTKEAGTLFETYVQSRSYGLGSEARRRTMIGAYVLSSGYYDAYYLQAQKVRTLVRQDFEKAFEEVDVILSLTTPQVAFKIGEKTKDPLTMYLQDVYTCPVNLAGLPAMSVPCGFVDGLPVGLQIIGRSFDEETIFELGKKYEILRDG